MALMARACERAGLTPAGTADRIARCCALYGLPTRTGYPLEALCAHAMGDKKRAGDRITLVTLERLGKAALHPVDAAELLDFMKGGAGR